MKKNKFVSAVVTGVGMLAALPAFAQINTNYTNIKLGSAPITDIVMNIINVGLGFLGIIAVVLVLAGGFKWMTAAGDKTKVEGAQKLLVAALIGLVIIMAAWGLSLYVIGVLGTATGTTVV